MEKAQRNFKTTVKIALSEPSKKSWEFFPRCMYRFSVVPLACYRLPCNQFEKVFVVSLPERSDKQDAIRLTASLTGFDFEILDGIKGASLPPKALPGVGRY